MMPGMPTPKPAPDTSKQDAIAAAKDQARAEMAANAKDTPMGGTADIDELARTRAERERERRAAEEELRLGKQRAIQQADARAGLGGFGLSGATSAQLSNVARAQDRTATLTLADLDRRQRDEDFQAVQRRAALDDLEDAQGRDLDGDGLIAGEKPGDPDQTSELESLQAKDLKGYVAENRAKAKDISRAEYERLPPGGLAWPSTDGYVYIVTREDPPRFLRVKAAVAGLGG
jgi:hypothetical protein